jgi:hypothetical protein
LLLLFASLDFLKFPNYPSRGSKIP